MSRLMEEKNCDTMESDRLSSRKIGIMNIHEEFWLESEITFNYSTGLDSRMSSLLF